MEDPFPSDGLKIAVIGGGTGSFTLLKSLKQYSHSIAAIVNMADDGGSTGVLRDELGTLPPGDVRQCLVALSESPKVRDLFNYRFEEGTFGGHSFGNILLTALEKVTGNFSEAVETASEILRVNGVVLPATLDNVRLKMEWPQASVILRGERVIDAEYFEHDPRRATLSLVPAAHPNPAAIEAILQADLVVIAPGDLYTSLGPLLVIQGVGDALRKTKAKVVYVSNLVTKKGQTEGFSVSDHADEIERFGGGSFLDYVLYNEQQPDAELAKRYEAEDAFLVSVDETQLQARPYKAVSGRFLGPIAAQHTADKLPVTRSLIRHDSEAVASAIIGLYNTLNGR
ncbi:MAG TPA: gluconeogenesis factor YvcK family protein [Verrucomicrobiae bacterium]|nr:gluconeogenesis factor YvcK family protein [Verrucomicrobiae bacterium]